VSDLFSKGNRLSSTGKFSTSGKNASAARARMVRVVRRGIGKVDRLDRIAARRAERREQVAALVELYDRLSKRFTSVGAAEHGSGLPKPRQVREVQAAALSGAFLSDVVGHAAQDGDVEKALVTLTRNLLRNKALQRARGFAQAMQSNPGMRPVGDICQALVTMRDPMLGTSWALLARNDLALVLRLAPVEYFRLGLVFEPQRAQADLDRVLTGEPAAVTDAAGWLDIARTSFVTGAEALAVRALDRCEHALADDPRAEQVRRDAGWLRSWCGRSERAAGAVELPEGEIAFGVLDYSRPDRRSDRVEPGDAFATLLGLGHVVRHRGIRFTGEPALVSLAGLVREHVRAEDAVDGPEATLRLYRVDRDASSYAAVPDGTWLLVSGQLGGEQLAGLRYDVPFNPRLRPIFIGVEIGPGALGSDGVVDYLRRYAPIGCRDWNTVFLLQAAGIPAFFSGWLQATAGIVSAPRVDSTQPVDGPLTDGIRRALQQLERWRGAAAPVATPYPGEYLAARSVGAAVSFRPGKPQRFRLEGLVDIPDDVFERMRRAQLDMLSAVLGAILAGAGEDEVHTAWRDVTAAAVGQAEQRRSELPEIAPPSFDVAEACRAVRKESVVVERSEPGPDGAEINLEFSLDGNFKHQLDVVLDSIVTHASRPLRAYVLCRDHDASDYKRMAALFPTVSFVWLPTDHVDYGRISGMLSHITVATMDRLLLPDLLPEVDRILHHDLDALCLGDLAELFDVAMGDAPIAARDQEHPFNGSGFTSLSRAADRSYVDLTRSRELTIRTHTHLRFDYRVFNAGVMVLNLARMRADDFCRQYLPYVERFGFNDQAVLNAYAGSERFPIEPMWNAYPKFELIDGAKILHWLGQMKPWKELYVQGRELWRAAEARTAQRIERAGV
jgi:lipopolysaccharide biosynthesis glycosyltransferase